MVPDDRSPFWRVPVVEGGDRPAECVGFHEPIPKLPQRCNVRFGNGAECCGSDKTSAVAVFAVFIASSQRFECIDPSSGCGFAAQGGEGINGLNDPLNNIGGSQDAVFRI